MKEFPIHAAGAVCHSPFVISTSPFSTLVGTFFTELIRGKESYVIRDRIRLTATSSGRFNSLFLRSFFKGYERSPSAGRSISNWLLMTS